MLLGTVTGAFRHSLTLSRPVVVKQLPGPSSPKLMAQFNIDLDSGIIRISQLINGSCPVMSQATLFSRVFVVPARIREGLVPFEIGAFNTEQTGYCKKNPQPFSTQTDGTVSFCF